MTDAEARRPSSGETLAHYRVEARLGEGAMGVVYRAHDTGLDRPVALKVLKPEVSEDAEFVDRFVREARAAARVAHPNLTHVYFVGEQGRHQFFAMELVEGQDLETWVEEHGPMPLGTAVDVIQQVTRGLAAAHRAGVVHRDVKPSNIILQPDGVVRITDFGLAKSLDADVSATQAGQVVGTPTYMSPEQCRGETVDPRTDVYALGLTAFYLLAGEKPYDADSLGSLINDQINTPLPALSGFRDDVPAGLDVALGRLCAKRQADRPSDMTEVHTLFERFRPRELHLATLVTRATAAAIDLAVPLLVVGQVYWVLEKLTGVQDHEGSELENVAFCVLFTLYQLGCEAKWGQTLGKWLLRIAVVGVTGAPEPKRALVPRFLLRYPAMAVGIFALWDFGKVFEVTVVALQVLAVAGGVIAYLVRRGRTVSDRVTHTRVVYKMSARGAQDEEAYDA